MNKPLNILFMMSDQWRWDTLLPVAEHVCRTPHLDRLSRQGVSFSNAFTCCPLCSPARGALLTGRWPHQTGLMDNVAGGSYYPQGKLHPDRRPTWSAWRTQLVRATAAGTPAAGTPVEPMPASGTWALATLLERGIDNVRLSDGGAPGSGRWRCAGAGR